MGLYERVVTAEAALAQAEELHDEFVNNVLDFAPPDWDGDEAAEWIAVRFVSHLVDEVMRLGGCLNPSCPASLQNPGSSPEPCDHGYPLTPASAPPEARSAVASFGGAHGVAGADRASAVPCRPAAPSTTRR